MRSILLTLVLAVASTLAQSGLRLPWRTSKNLTYDTIPAASVTQASQGYLILCTPNPIVDTGEIAFDTATFKVWLADESLNVTVIKGTRARFTIAYLDSVTGTAAQFTRFRGSGANLTNVNAVTLQTKDTTFTWPHAAAADSAVIAAGSHLLQTKDTTWVKGLFTGGCDPTAFHHNDTTDTLAHLWAQGIQLRDSVQNDLSLMEEGCPFLFRSASGGEGGDYAYEIRMMGESGWLEYKDSIAHENQRTYLYWDGFECLDTTNQASGDSMGNPEHRAYMGIAWNDRALSGKKSPYAHIAQSDSAQARIMADSAGLTAEVTVLGSTGTAWSDTSYITPTKWYTNGWANIADSVKSALVSATTIKGAGILSSLTMGSGIVDSLSHNADTSIFYLWVGTKKFPIPNEP